MDKNTITGLVLIGILLVGFSFLSRPSEEQIAAQKKYYDSIAVVQQQEEALKAKTEAALANSQKEVPILLLCFSMPCMEPTLKSASRIM
jgi:YidC/Oxa1 family membrane protein insertase